MEIIEDKLIKITGASSAVDSSQQTKSEYR